MTLLARRPAADTPAGTNPQIGPVALSDQAPSFPVASFDWIRFDPDGTGGGGGGGADVVDDFDGTALGSAWEVVRRRPGSDGQRRCAAHPRRSRATSTAARDNAQNLTLRDVPGGPWTATAKMNFEGTPQYHQAG